MSSLYNKDYESNLEVIDAVKYDNTSSVFSQTLYQNITFSESLIVLCLSSRDHFHQRNLIRKSWMSNYPDFYFMVGKYYCQWPKWMRLSFYQCELSYHYQNLDMDFKYDNFSLYKIDKLHLNNWFLPVNNTLTCSGQNDKKKEKLKTLDSKLRSSKQCTTWGDAFLNLLKQNKRNIRKDLREKYTKWLKTFDEVVRHRTKQNFVTKKLAKEPNVILLPMIDTYENLTEKTLLSLRWVHEMNKFQHQGCDKSFSNCHRDFTLGPKKKFTHILKIDDDAIALPHRTRDYLNKNFNIKQPENKFLYYGQICAGVHVRMDGKWGDSEFEQVRYPTYMNGASGYVLSQPLVDYLGYHYHNFTRYALEDAAIGIYIHRSNYMRQKLVKIKECNQDQCQVISSKYWKDYLAENYVSNAAYRRTGSISFNASRLLFFGHQLGDDLLKLLWNNHLNKNGSYLPDVFLK